MSDLAKLHGSLFSVNEIKFRATHGKSKKHKKHSDLMVVHKKRTLTSSAHKVCIRVIWRALRSLPKGQAPAFPRP